MSQQIQNLTDEFNTLLTEYKNTYQKYISVINSDERSFATIPDFSFIGNNIDTMNNSSLSNCQNSCLNNENCSGATFINNSNNCILSSGEGNIVNTPQSTAIIQQSIFYSYKLQQINTKLTDINRQIMDINNNNYNDFKNNQQQQTQEKDKLLNNNYQVLANERIEIEKMIRQFETLNTAQNEGDILVSSNYFIYISLTIITILLVFLLIKYNIPNEQRGGGKLSLNNNGIITILGLFVIIIFYKIFI
jgi:ATP-dependent Zn protease